MPTACRPWRISTSTRPRISPAAQAAVRFSAASTSAVTRGGRELKGAGAAWTTPIALPQHQQADEARPGRLLFPEATHPFTSPGAVAFDTRRGDRVSRRLRGRQCVLLAAAAQAQRHPARQAEHYQEEGPKP